MNLIERTEKVYFRMESQARELSRRLRESYSEYFSGRILEPHPDLFKDVVESGTDEAQIRLVLDYAFLNYTQSALPRVAEEFIKNYSRFRFDPNYSFDRFLLFWDSESRRFVQGEELGTYSPLIAGVINHLERTRELQSHFYDEEFLVEAGFDRYGLICTLANNADLINRIFTESVEGGVGERLGAIVSGKTLAIEAGNCFLDAYPRHKKNQQYKKGVGNFLDRYDLEKGKFVRKGKGHFSHLYKKLIKQRGGLWKKLFFDLLDDPLKSRVELLDRQIGSRGGIEEDKYELLERLAKQEELCCLHLFAGEGSDLGDILLASKIGSFSREELKSLSGVLSGRRSLSGYLGTCRVDLRDTEIEYDARKCFNRLCESVDPVVFAENEIIASILFHKMKGFYEQDFVRDKERCVERLRQEIDSESDEPKKILLRRTLNHYELRIKVDQVSGLKNKIVVIE